MGVIKAVTRLLNIIVCLTLSLCFALTPALASPSPAGLTELLDLALDLNPQIIAARLELEKAKINLRGSIGQTRLQVGIEGELARGYTPLPGDRSGSLVNLWTGSIASRTSTYLPTGSQLSLLAEMSNFKTVGNNSIKGDGEPSYTINISQPLFRSVSTLPLWKGIGHNQRAVQQQEIEMVKAKRDVAVTLLEAYLSAWERQEQLASVERRLAWASQELSKMEQDLAAGNVTQLDFLETNLRHEELTIESQGAKINYTRSLDNLFRIVGVKELEIILEPLQNIDFLTNLGLETLSPEVELAKLAVATNQTNYTAVKADNSWQSSLNGFYTKEGNWQVSLNLQVPLFNSGVASSQEQVSQLQLQQSQRNLEIITEQVQRQQQELLQDTKIAAERLKLAQQSLALAEQRKEVVNLRAELGAVSFTERYSVVEQWETAYLRLIALKKQYQLLEIQAWFFM